MWFVLGLCIGIIIPATISEIRYKSMFNTKLKEYFTIEFIKDIYKNFRNSI